MFSSKPNIFPSTSHASSLALVMQIELFSHSWLIGCDANNYLGQVWIGRWIAVMFWILNQSVHRINYPCIYYVHSSETQIANGLLKWQFPFYSGMHACMYAHMYTHVHTVWERSSGYQLRYATDVLERNVPTHITKTEDLLNSMETNLQSVIFWEFYPVLVYAFTGPPLGLLGELWTLNFELLT